MITRCIDAAIPNQFTAHPDIAPDIDGPIDFSGAMNLANVFLFGAHGGLIFEWKGPQTFEVHVMATREGRGRWIFEATRQAVNYMEAMGANHLWARIHPDKPHVGILARKSGFNFAGYHDLNGVAWHIYNRRT